jgi:membrane protein YqaA with SNARE-associated domain
VVASLASVLGGIVGYAVGYFLFDTIGARVVALYRLQDELLLVEQWLAANAFLATFLSAFTPIPYKVFTLTAGLFHAPFFIFIIASLVGRGMRYFLVCFIAYRWGATLARLFLRNFTIATVAVIVFAAVAYIGWHLFVGF